jgi:hypothetical protein
MRRRLLEPRTQAELQFTSRGDDFQHLMLGMIAKLSPCSEERLLDVVAGQAGRKSLRSRNKSIRQSVRELQERRFVDMIGDQLVVTEAGRRHLQIKSFTAPMGTPSKPSVKEVVTKQRQDVEPWKEAASGFEKAVEALRTAEPDTPGESRELSSQRSLDADTDLGTEAQEEAPLELSPDLALLDAGIAQGSLTKFEEKPSSSITEQHGLGSEKPVLLNQVHSWPERHAEIWYRPRFAWLIENIPRRMRAHVSIEAEVKVSTMAAEVAGEPVGQGKTGLYGTDTAQALSLQLSALKAGVLIEAQSPETQWVRKGGSQSVDELGAWRFIITPNRRGSNSLRLTFSYKEIGPNGLLVEGALPDRVLDIVVSANLPKALNQAAIWVATLIVGITLGIYFEPAIQFISRLYQ